MKKNDPNITILRVIDEEFGSLSTVDRAAIRLHEAGIKWQQILDCQKAFGDIPDPIYNSVCNSLRDIEIGLKPKARDERLKYLWSTKYAKKSKASRSKKS